MGPARDMENHFYSSLHDDLLFNTLVKMPSEQSSEVRSDIGILEMQPVATVADKAENAIQNLQEGFSELAIMVQTTSYNGSFIWKIPEVQRRRHEAKIGKTISLYSVPYYTSRKYKAYLTEIVHEWRWLRQQHSPVLVCDHHERRIRCSFTVALQTHSDSDTVRPRWSQEHISGLPTRTYFIILPEAQ